MDFPPNPPRLRHDIPDTVLHMTINTELLTIGDAAAHLGCREWQLRRLFSRGLVGEAARLGRTRIIPRAQLPRLRKALERAGYLEPLAAH
jgi:hypothetical protein